MPNTRESFKLLGDAPSLRRRATAVIESDSGVLLVRDRYKTSFSLPGGEFEGKESGPEAATREVQEELGLRVTKAELLPDCCYRSKHNQHIVCRLEVVGDPTLNDHELAEFRWCSRDDLPQCFPHVGAILRQIPLAPREPKNPTPPSNHQ